MTDSNLLFTLQECAPNWDSALVLTLAGFTGRSRLWRPNLGKRPRLQCTQVSGGLKSWQFRIGLRKSPRKPRSYARVCWLEKKLSSVSSGICKPG